jgi:tetratricopeptide (TPR) repeat protein
MTPSANPHADTLRNLINDILELMPVEGQQLLYLAAVPNAFTITLLEKMAGTAIDVAGNLENLSDLSFLKKGQGNWLYLDADVRDILNAHWRNREFRVQFEQCNQEAVEYFERLSTQSPAPGNHTFQREVLYHRLLQDESDGLVYLAQVFENCMDQHAFGQAQAYQERLQAVLPQLSPTAADHNIYYQSRLDFIHHRRDALDTRLMQLIEHTPDPFLKTRANVLLGQLWSSQYRWTDAVTVLQKSVHDHQRLGITSNTAKAMLALGDVYVNIARYSGGWQDDFSVERRRLRQFFYLLVFLPYRILDWLRRKLDFFPSLFYFSGNYQDWILNYLFRTGGRWYRKALQAAQRTGNPVTILEATFGLAEVALYMRRETRAARIYAQLERLAAVRSSSYRAAQVAFGRGRVLLLAGKVDAARGQLLEALKVFLDYEDTKRVADVTYALGETEWRSRNPDASVERFLDSLRSYNIEEDSLAQTQVLLKVEELAESHTLPEATRIEIEKARELTPNHYYLARFPTNLLHRFRTLGYWVTLPVLYLSTILVGLAAGITISIIESQGLQGVSAFILSLQIAIFPLTIALWTIELVFCLIGQSWVQIFARISLDRLGEEPDRLIINHQTVTFIHANKTIQSSWQDIKTIISENYALWHRPISLYSRQILAIGDRFIILEGITNAFSKLTTEIQQRAAITSMRLKADTSILSNLWTLLALLVSFLHAVYLYMIGKIGMTALDPSSGKEIPLIWSIVFMFTVINWLIIFPPIVLWRMYYNQRVASRLCGYRSTLSGSTQIIVTAVILSMIALSWLIITPILSIGSEDEPETYVHQQEYTIGIQEPVLLWSPPERRFNSRQRTEFTAVHVPVLRSDLPHCIDGCSICSGVFHHPKDGSRTSTPLPAHLPFPQHEHCAKWNVTLQAIRIHKSACVREL